MVGFFSTWRGSLEHFLGWFQDVRGRTRYFPLKAFLFFCAINLAFFWWALLTAYPAYVVGPKVEEYALMGFPVAVLGAVFDCLSLVATLFIVGRALRSTSNNSFLAYLSVDVVIAVLAGLWVLFAFVVSGWLVSFILSSPETMAYRSTLYQGRLTSLLNAPFSPDNLRNLYFGVIMGASALFPTLFHFLFACSSWFRLAITQPAAGGFK